MDRILKSCVEFLIEQNFSIHKEIKSAEFYLWTVLLYRWTCYALGFMMTFIVSYLRTPLLAV